MKKRRAAESREFLSGSGLEGENRGRGCGNVGNAAAIAKGFVKPGKPALGFPGFTNNRHFHSPLGAVGRVVLAAAKRANSLRLACCMRRAAAVSLSALAMRSRTCSVCPGLR